MTANTVSIEKITDLYQVFEEPIYLSGKTSHDQFYKELYANSWGIIVEDEFAKKIKADDIAEFISDLVKFRSKEISMIKPTPHATLYFWFDQQALQLCFNILSGAKRKLPFGCKINIIDSPYPILKEFITVARNNALYGNYLGITKILEKGDPGYGDDFEIDPDKFIPNVWRIALPWNGETEDEKA